MNAAPARTSATSFMGAQRFNRLQHGFEVCCALDQVLLLDHVDVWLAATTHAVACPE